MLSSRCNMPLDDDTDDDDDLPNDDDDDDDLMFSLTEIDGLDDARTSNRKSSNKNNSSISDNKSYHSNEISTFSKRFQGEIFSGELSCPVAGENYYNIRNNFPKLGISDRSHGDGYHGYQENGCRGDSIHKNHVDDFDDSRHGDGHHGDGNQGNDSHGDGNHEAKPCPPPTRWGGSKPIPLRLNIGLHLREGVAQSLDSHHQRPNFRGVGADSAILGTSIGGSGGAYSSSPKLNWMQAVKKVRHIKDSWEKYKLNDLPVETAIRHRYHALKRQWFTDKVEVKMEKESFDQGAMRSCYRLKKLPSSAHGVFGLRDWKQAHNYVAKRYIEDVGRETYFTDVQMQLDAKLWGEEYNRHNPPKKVDIVQMAVLEFQDGPEGSSRFYHLENYIEGQYTKYNSNSGFVDQCSRSTPQAFSHFTFERSGHQLIVIDIQGVGDLWTDPQIHTVDGERYGDGNLGVKGMALFFHSHVCNAICESLGLSKFDLTASESPSPTTEKSVSCHTSATTRVRGDEEMCIAASPAERVNLRQFLEREKQRRLSVSSYANSVLSEEASDSEEISPRVVDEVDNTRSPLLMSPHVRNRYWSESDDSGLSSTRSEEEERMKFQLASSNQARPACVANELNERIINNVRRTTDSVLGQIHHELAKYHEMGRFTERGADADMSAALYHEQYAADLGIKEAMVTLASIYFNLPHEILVNVSLERSDENIRKGMEYMEMAAEAGDRGAMLYLARAYETNQGLSSDRSQSYRDAVDWYQAAACMTIEDDSGEYDATMDSPLYELKAKIAQLYLEGGHGLEKDASYAGELFQEAAECATAAMKGRVANKYYALAEEAWSQVDDSGD